MTVESAYVPVALVGVDHVARAVHVAGEVYDVKQALQGGGVVQFLAMFEFFHAFLYDGHAAVLRVAVGAEG